MIPKHIFAECIYTLQGTSTRQLARLHGRVAALPSSRGAFGWGRGRDVGRCAADFGAPWTGHHRSQPQRRCLEETKRCGASPSRHLLRSDADLVDRPPPLAATQLLCLVAATLLQCCPGERKRFGVSRCLFTVQRVRGMGHRPLADAFSAVRSRREGESTRV